MGFKNRGASRFIATHLMPWSALIAGMSAYSVTSRAMVAGTLTDDDRPVVEEQDSSNVDYDKRVVAEKPLATVLGDVAAADARNEYSRDTNQPEKNQPEKNWPEKNWMEEETAPRPAEETGSRSGAIVASDEKHNR